MGFLGWWGSGSPKYSSPLVVKLCRTPESFRGARTCSRSSITTPSLVGLGFHPPPGGQKGWVSLFVCLFVWTSEFVRPISPWRSWSTEMILMPLDRGRFVVVRSCGDTTKCRSSKKGKNWGFSPPEGDRINRSRLNLARERIPWVCSIAPNLALMLNEP